MRCASRSTPRAQPTSSVTRWASSPSRTPCCSPTATPPTSNMPRRPGSDHARCWAHGRRGFFEALTAEPTGAAEALEQIKAIYAIEEEIRERKLAGDDKQLHRLTHSKPLVELFFDWVDRATRAPRLHADATRSSRR